MGSRGSKRLRVRFDAVLYYMPCSNEANIDIHTLLPARTSLVPSYCCCFLARGAPGLVLQGYLVLLSIRPVPSASRARAI